MSPFGVSFEFSIDKLSPGTKAFSLSIKILIASSIALIKSVVSNMILFSWKLLEFKLSTIDLYIFEIKFKQTSRAFSILPIFL
jgi:hypothetical protein